MIPILTGLLRGAARLWDTPKVLLLAISLLFGTLGYSQTLRQQPASYYSQFGPNALVGYYVYFPVGYEDNPTQQYPVLLFLHGAGEKTSNPPDLRYLPAVKTHGPPKLIEQGQDFPFIVISPQSPFMGWDEVTTNGNYNTFEYRPGQFVNEILETVKTRYRIDANRVYVTGLSMGGGGTYGFLAYYPQKTTAAIPIAGWPTMNNQCAVAANNVAFWAFYGGDDPGYGQVTTYRDMINSCSPAPNPLAKATIYPGVGHDAWTQTYNNTGPGIAPDNIYEWFMRQTKNPLVNIPPYVNAGADITLTLPTNSTTLTGTARDYNGTVASYAWTKVSGPSATLSGATTATLSLSNLVAGEYVFRLTATDNNGASSGNNVKVTVNGDQPPVTNGLNAAYYPSLNFTGTPVVQVDATVNFEWGNNAPGNGIPSDNYTVRWTGKVKPLYSETYTFYTTTDDGVRLWVNGTQVINNWTDHGTFLDTGLPIVLAANQLYDITLEYYEKTGGAVAKLEWSSASQSKQIIPNAQLFRTGTPPPPNGLKAEYFPSLNHTGTPVTRVDPVVDFNWGTTAPVAGIGADYYSVRWTGKVKADYSQTYTFYTRTDDGVRLWVNGQQLINNWTDHGAFEDAYTIALTAGQLYNIKMEYYEKTGDALAQLSWSSASVPKQIIPSDHLFQPVSPRTEAGLETEVTDLAKDKPTVYPVPAKDEASLLYHAVQSGQIDVMISNELSQDLLHKSFAVGKGRNTLSLDLSTVPNGVYVLMVTGNGARQTSKLIVNK